MTDSVRITIVLKTDDALGEHLATDGGEALYYCVVHEGCGYLPYANAWPEPDLRAWISQWQPLRTAESPLAGEGLDQDDFSTTLEPRPEANGEKQATFRGYQLYTLSADARGEGYRSGRGMKVGEVSGFWRLVTPELEEAVLECDDPATEPSIARGP